MTQTVGFIGSGNIGGTVARLAVAAGYDVVMSNSRGPETLAELVAELDSGGTTSSELLQRHLPTAYVVKVFNNIFFKHLASLARPAGASDRSALAIAGDDDGAKAAVTAFLDAIGYDAVDAGPLGAGGRLYQVDTPAYGRPYGAFTDPTGTPADAATIRAALDAA